MAAYIRNFSFSIITATALAACGGGGSSGGSNNTASQSATSTMSATLSAGTQALNNLGTALTAPSAGASLQGFEWFTQPRLLAFLPLSAAHASTTDANGCNTQSGSAGNLTDPNDLAIKDVLCSFTTDSTTARYAVRKAVETVTSMPKALLALNGMAADGVDRPGPYSIVFNSTTYNLNFSKLIITSPAKFEGVEHAGFKYGIEFTKTGTTGQTWRLAMTEASGGFRKIKWFTDQSLNTGSNSAGEGYEMGYLEVNSTADTVRFFQHIVPNSADMQTGHIRQQLYAAGFKVGTGANTFPSALNFALFNKRSTGGSNTLELAQRVNGQELIKAQSYNLGSGVTETTAQAKCARLVSSTTSVCSQNIGLDSAQVSAFTAATFANDADALDQLKTAFNNVDSSASSWTKPAVITTEFAQ